MEEPRKWVYGYVFYRQNRDSTIHRGYLQKSIAILSENNLVDFYQRVIAIIGETYFEYGEKALDMAWRDIIAWPTPQLSHQLSFPLLGKVLKFPMPSIRNGSFIFTPLPSVLDSPTHKASNSNGKQAASPSSSVKIKAFGPDLKISPSAISLDDRFLHTVPVYAPLAPIMSKIWLLWELVLLGRPILVLSPEPGLSSDAVLALASLISPLEYKGDFRPFFTIHDSDFKTFSDDMIDIQLASGGSGLIVGATNAYFSKALSHWGNVVTLSGKKKVYKNNPFLLPTQIDPDADIDESANRSVGVIEYADHVTCFAYHAVFPAGIDLKKYAKKPSKEVSAEEAYNFNEKLLRYHLHLRTTTFLAPLRHFFDRIVSSKANTFKPLAKIPIVGELSSQTLAAIKTHLAPGRGNPEIRFYDQFLATATFKRWYNKKRKIANDKLALDYNLFLQNWKQTKPFNGLDEMDLVNLYQDALDQIKKEADILGPRGVTTVKDVIEDLIPHLDPDLQAAIKMKSDAAQQQLAP